MMRAVLVLALLAMGGAARAESSQIRFEAEAPAPAIRLPRALAQPQASDLLIATAEADAPPARQRGVAQTSVDHRFSPSGEVIGSLGYLCGILKNPDGVGELKSSYEPAGTFLGGQLKVAF